MKFKLKTTYKPTGDQPKAIKQIFIMLVGFSQSGKTTLAKKIAKEFAPFFTRINSDSIHDFLNMNYKIFQDDKTITGKGYDLRQKTTSAIKKVLIKELIASHYSVILDSCNLVKAGRLELLRAVKKVKKDIVTVIIFVKIPEIILYGNLRRADKKKKARGEKSAWVDLYEKVQKAKLDKPHKNEADYLLIYNYPKEKSALEQVRTIIFKK
ncbi:MAG: hypothetical protein A2Y82_03730 [Candidatus Buchananbacteria bacterium RBG_13_36_9]|uniref:Uncharacterized protein n=1 Tax=Candidatus Buchananbacteria bacterium RBG_13_36_9 TaxID=1797530 RepID=A0A1G1XLI2_9BACT|nr:MAG: hypothetical protein A2Y82_03730 [Candidatus Buchananbacteria bacterium RBG_13_36_9]